MSICFELIGNSIYTRAQVRKQFIPEWKLWNTIDTVTIVDYGIVAREKWIVVAGDTGMLFRAAKKKLKTFKGFL